MWVKRQQQCFVYAVSHGYYARPMATHAVRLRHAVVALAAARMATAMFRRALSRSATTHADCSACSAVGGAWTRCSGISCGSNGSSHALAGAEALGYYARVMLVHPAMLRHAAVALAAARAAAAMLRLAICVQLLRTLDGGACGEAWARFNGIGCRSNDSSNV